MGRKSCPVTLVVYKPSTPEGELQLAKRVSDAHASAVHQTLKSLNCPEQQKLVLLEAVMETVSQRGKQETAE